MKRKALSLLLCILAYMFLAVIHVPIVSAQASAFYADLVPTLTGPSSANAGDDIKDLMKLAVTNDGTAEAGQFSTGLYLSTDATITTDDTLLIGGREFVDSLAAGASTKVTLYGGTIPADTQPGQYYIGVVVDELNSIKESNERNNTDSFSICIGGDCSTRCPDLVPTLSTRSLVDGADCITGTPGEDIRPKISLSVANNGNTEAGTFTTGLYLSNDSTITTSDTLLFGGREHVSSLAAGATSNITLYGGSIPSGTAPGTYYLGVVIDEFEYITECDETNNTDAVCITISGSTSDCPELELSLLTLGSTFSPGSHIEDAVTVTVVNSGTAAAGAFDIGMYLSSDNSITTSDFALSGGTYTVNSLAAGSYQTITFDSLILPESYTPGTYYLGCLLDVNNDVDECTDFPNFTMNQITIISGYDDCPDLKPSMIEDTMNVTDDHSLYNLQPGESVEDLIHVIAENIGEAYATEFSYGLYLSTDTTINTDDVLLTNGRREYNDGIDAGDWVTLIPHPSNTVSTPPATMTIPTGTASGTYYLGIFLDDKAWMDECDETNNTAYVMVKVVNQGSTTDCPDLVPSMIEDTMNMTDDHNLQNLQPGEVVGDLVQVMAENKGDAYATEFSYGLYLSKDTTINSDDILLTNGQREYNDGINAGDWVTLIPHQGTAATAPAAMSIPTGTAAGTYYLGVFLDDKAWMDECDETNNTTYIRVQVKSSGGSGEECPDLICKLDGPRFVQPGDDITDLIDQAVGNIGTTDAGTFNVRLIISDTRSITINNSHRVIAQGTLEALAAGMHTSVVWNEAALTIPEGLADGSYYLAMYADYDEEVDECKEDNNFAAVPIQVSGSCPDLKPQITGPASANPGDNLMTSLNLTVTNFGAAEAGQFSTGLYLSTDEDITTSDTLLTGGREFVDSLAAGATVSVTLNGGTIPSSVTPGTYYLGVVVDELDAVDECEETNNTAYYRIDIGGTVCTKADLIPRLQAPGSAAPGAVLGHMLKVKVTNAGQSDAGLFSVGLYISTDAAITDDDTLLVGGREFVSGLKPNQSTMVKLYPDMHLSADLATGNYYIGVIVDELQAVDECDETNNTDALKFEITGSDCTKPDLAVSFTAPKGGTVGESIKDSLEVKVHNIGAADAGSFDVKVYLAKKESWGYDLVAFVEGTATVSSLQSTWAVPSVAFSGSVTIPTVAPGFYELYICATGDFEECIDKNNCASEPFYVRAADCTGADLVVDIEYPIKFPAGGSLASDLGVVVGNVGPAASGPFTVGVYLSEDHVIDTTDTLLIGGEQIVNTLGSGEQAEVAFTGSLTVPSTLAPGGYYIGAYVDNKGEETECTETNNTDAYIVEMTAAHKAGDYTGWWYTPGEPGSGLSMEIQNDVLFLVWYIYDTAGNPTWYASWLEPGEGNTYTGDLRYYTGWEVGTPWSAPKYSSIGKVSVTFSDDSHGVFEWSLSTVFSNPGIKDIEKYMPSLVPGGSADSRDLAGWYIAPGYSGMGFFMEAFGDTLFLGWYNYRADGSPKWRTLGGWTDVGGFPEGTTTYTAELEEYTGGQTIGGPWQSATQSLTGEDVKLTFTTSGSDTDISLEWEGTTYDLAPYEFSSVPE